MAACASEPLQPVSLPCTSPGCVSHVLSIPLDVMSHLSLRWEEAPPLRLSTHLGLTLVRLCPLPQH